jgi:hypothetical protein
MLDRFTFPLIVLAAAAVIALAMVWPQGYGARSFGPFGHTPIQQTPEMQAAMKREHDEAMRRQAEAQAAPPPAAAPAPPPSIAPAAPAAP